MDQVSQIILMNEYDEEAWFVASVEEPAHACHLLERFLGWAREGRFKARFSYAAAWLAFEAIYQDLEFSGFERASIDRVVPTRAVSRRGWLPWEPIARGADFAPSWVFCIWMGDENPGRMIVADYLSIWDSQLDAEKVIVGHAEQSRKRFMGDAKLDEKVEDDKA